jgi:GNAT superfamily N-acetyltransferase
VIHEPGSAFGLVPAGEADFEPLLALRMAAMRESLERVGRFDPARSRERFRASFVAAHTQCVVACGERVGFFALRPADDGLWLDHLYVAPSWQGRGIGAAVLNEVFASARAARQPVRLGALRDSDANRFYRRHGFVQTHETQWDCYYVWNPA